MATDAVPSTFFADAVRLPLWVEKRIVYARDNPFYCCPICERTYMHVPPGPHCVLIFHATCSRMNDMRNHVMSEHVLYANLVQGLTRDKGTNQCPSCPSTFKRRADLKTHARVKHDQ
jgi:ribosomal protein L37AE/L43A